MCCSIQEQSVFTISPARPRSFDQADPWELFLGLPFEDADEETVGEAFAVGKGVADVMLAMLLVEGCLLTSDFVLQSGG